jgi:hypothetical protein
MNAHSNQSQASKLSKIMKTTDFSVIDQMYSAVLSQNESKERVDALRPQVEAAVKELIRQRGLPKDFTGTIEHNGIKVIVRRPTSYTWEQNTQIRDVNIDMYKALHAKCAQLDREIKARRAEMRGVGKSLELQYADSESIKHGFTVAFG